MNCDSIIVLHNELAISVDPADSNHIVAGSNELELFNVGRTVVQRIIACLLHKHQWWHDMVEWSLSTRRFHL